MKQPTRAIYLLAMFCWVALAPSEGFGQHMASDSLVVCANTTDNTISINGQLLEVGNIQAIMLLLGKPDRIVSDSVGGYMEEMDRGGKQPMTRAVSLFSKYYIYDQLGLMFYNEGVMYRNVQPEAMAVYFPNKQVFDNRRSPSQKPRQFFKGTFIINHDVVDTHRNFIPKGVDYLTHSFIKHGAEFGPMSYGGVIDGLYGMNTQLYMEIYLDAPKTQRVSFVVLRDLE